jgi:hypothetical protein
MPSSVELVCIDPARIDEMWPHVRDKIRAAVERTGLSSFADIEADVLTGMQLVWIAWDGKEILAAATTQLVKPLSKVCVVTACAGYDRERWLSLFAEIEKYAENEGCKSMRIFGRKGWERVLTGFRTEHVILEKKLAKSSSN